MKDELPELLDQLEIDYADVLKAKKEFVNTGKLKKSTAVDLFASVQSIQTACKKFIDYLTSLTGDLGKKKKKKEVGFVKRKRRKK